MIKVNDVIIEQNHFPDNTLLLKDLPVPIFPRPITIIWNYENDAELFTLICIRRHYNNYPVNLEMPYLPHARQDRVKGIHDVFTLKYFCEVINYLKFNHVYVFDVHSNVSLALLDNVEELKPYYTIDSVIESIPNNPLLFYPDEGAMKRYSNIINMPYTFGIKNRDWETGKILGLTIMDSEAVKDRDILIIDDICSRGGTFLHSAKTLKDLGAKNIYLYVSHLEKTVLEGELYQEMKENDLIKTIYTANPLFEITDDIERIIKL